MTLGQFTSAGAHWRVMADLALLSLFAGLYSVPMYALIQLRAQPTHRARIIAANNILNALFMIASSVIAGVLLKLGMTIPQIFLLVGLANAVVASYIFMLVPEYLLRFIAWIALAPGLSLQDHAATNTSRSQGAAILVCNHVSFVDAVLLMAASPRPICFLMDHQHLQGPGAGLGVQAGQGHSHRAAQGRSRRLRSCVRRGGARCCAKATCSRSSRRAPSPTTVRCRSSRAAS